MDSIDKKLLNLLQAEIPLTRTPYAELGSRLGIDEDEVIHRIQQLKTEGLIRQISPIVDAAKLGYRTTLAAMKIAESKIAEAERLIGEHPLVSHGYERNHIFNVWFTLAVPPSTDMETEFEKLTSPLGAEAAFTLPVLKLFKLDVRFDMESNSHSASVAQPNRQRSQRLRLSPSERLVINELQQDLPLVATPFAGMAAKLNMDETEFLAHCQSLVQYGVIRRFSGSLNHRQAGFKANAMTCWAVPPDRVDDIGGKLATLPEVSHCYERKTNPLWRYNLFAMTHAQSIETCQQIAERISHETGLTDYVLLFSTREFKKARNKYLYEKMGRIPYVLSSVPED